jgi:hypothetical protein
MSSAYGSPTGSPGRMSASSRTGESIPRGYQKGQLQNFTPEMMQLFQQLIGQLGPDSFLSKIAGGDEGAFAEMEAPAMRQFHGLQGQLASRFSAGGHGPGAMSSRHSSGFQNASNNAASEFAQKLQSNRLGLRRQAIGDLQNMGNQLLKQRPYENILTKNPDFLSQILGGAGDITDMITKLLPFFI